MSARGLQVQLETAKLTHFLTNFVLKDAEGEGRNLRIRHPATHQLSPGFANLSMSFMPVAMPVAMPVNVLAVLHARTGVCGLLLREWEL